MEQLEYAVSTLWAVRELIRSGEYIKRVTEAECTEYINRAFEKFEGMEIDDEIITALKEILVNPSSRDDAIKSARAMCSFFLAD